MTEEISKRRMPYEPADIESFVRPLFGLYIAIAFGIIFKSVFLGLLAGAFLVYIPIPNGESGKGVMTVNKILFGIIMVVIMFLAFSAPGTLGLGLDMGSSFFTPWEWNTNAIIFGGVWLISFITGLLADLESRQIIGAVTIAISFVIFAMGVGSQEVGEAFFGQWWPIVHNTMNTFLEPMQQVFSGMQSMFGDSFLLLTNPIGYASRIMNGTYADNPTGSTGPLGIEIKSVDIDQIYVAKPFMITTIIKNEGAFDAKNVLLSIRSTLPWTPESSRGPAGWMPMSVFGLQPNENKETDRIEIGDFIQQDMRQNVFFFDSLTCQATRNYNLQNRYLPFRITVSYDYKVDSETEVQFMDTQEWDRVVRENKLLQTPVVSKVSTAPVRLSLGTLDQPIREGTPFYLALRIDSAKENSDIDSAEVYLKVPEYFGKPTLCTPHNPVESQITKEGDKYVYHWSLYCSGELCVHSNTIYCKFKAIEIDKPTQTFFIYANSTYRISVYKTVESFLEFGDQEVCTT